MKYPSSTIKKDLANLKDIHTATDKLTVFPLFEEHGILYNYWKYLELKSDEAINTNILLQAVEIYQKELKFYSSEGCKLLKAKGLKIRQFDNWQSFYKATLRNYTTQSILAKFIKDCISEDPLRALLEVLKSYKEVLLLKSLNDSNTKEKKIDYEQKILERRNKKDFVKFIAPGLLIFITEVIEMNKGTDYSFLDRIYHIQ